MPKGIYPHAGRPMSAETRAKIGEKSAGRTHSEETRKKMRLAKLGRVPGNRAGKKTSEEARTRISQAMSGPGNPRWRGGHGDDRYCKEWRSIRRVIRTRDGHLCQYPRCYTPEMGSPHPVHHIDYDRGHNDHRNLITLCRQHHDLTIHGDKEYWTEFYQELQIRRFSWQE